MAKLLETGNHREVDYNRPNQVWSCGHACDGKSCALGPSERGNCRGGAECLPLLVGDRWECSRPEHSGGSCEEGPLANGACCRSLPVCDPRPMQRTTRRRMSLALVLLTCGALLIIFAGRSADRDRVISAGPLGTGHAFEGMSCAACHDDVAEPLASGEKAAAAIPGHIGAMSGNCLECHANMAGESNGAAGYAHGLLPDTLHRTSQSSSTEKDQQQAGMLLRWISHGAVPEKGQQGSLSCETCHSEHHGKLASLTELSNQQCQICHQRQFASFSEGHPSFAETEYPYRRRTRLFFDHASHYGKHFEGEKKQFAPIRLGAAASATDGNRSPEAEQATRLTSESCRACHSADQNGQRMLVNGYEASCAACHADAVHGGNHLPLLTLPSLPTPTEAGKAESEVAGRWPAVADGAFPLTPLMVALLPADQRAAAGKLPFEVLGGESTGNRYLSADAAATGSDDEGASIARAVQQIWDEVWRDGPQALEARLLENGWPVQRVDSEGRPGEEPALFAGLSLDSLRSFLFPGYPISLYELTFPALDTTRLNEFLIAENRSIGTWPARANAELSPLLRLLLDLNPQAQSALSGLDKDGIRLADLGSANAAQLAAAEQVAWQIKRLYADFRDGRGAELIRRLQPLQGGILNGMSDQQLLARAFSSARKDSAMEGAFATEFADYQGGRFPPAIAPSPTLGGSPLPPPSKPGGADDDFGAAPAPAPAATSGADDDFGAAPAPAPAATSGADDDFGAAPAPAPAPAATGGADDDFGAAAAPAPAATSGADDDFGAAAAAAPAAPPREKAPEQVQMSPPVEPSAPADWQKNGGWFFDSEGRHALSYVSRGHADPALQRWLEVLTAAASSQNDRVREDALLVLGSTFDFREGVKTSSSGKCLKCHTVDVSQRDEQSALYRVNWTARILLSDEAEKLTHFDHQAHSFAMDCTECHQLEQDDPDGGAYADFFATLNALHPTTGSDSHAATNNPHHYRSNFRAIDHQISCANCHQPQLAGNACLQCHSYHHRNEGGE